MAAGSEPAARSPWAAIARALRTTRVALMQVTRRLAEAGTAGGTGPPRTNSTSTPMLRDEYRAGFAPRRPPAESAVTNHGECQWCRLLGDPEPRDRPGPSGSCS